MKPEVAKDLEFRGIFAVARAPISYQLWIPQQLNIAKSQRPFKEQITPRAVSKLLVKEGLTSCDLRS